MLSTQLFSYHSIESTASIMSIDLHVFEINWMQDFNNTMQKVGLHFKEIVQQIMMLVRCDCDTGLI